MAEGTVNFDADVVGVPPSGWTVTKTGTGNPQWTVEQKTTAPSRSKIVKQSGRATFPVLLKDDTNIKDGFIETRFKLPNLTARDKAQLDMTEFFDFVNKPWATPPTPPVQPTSMPCDYSNLK